MRRLTISLLSLLTAALPSLAQDAAPADSVATADQNVIVIDPLFEYPIAPDDLSSLTDRTNWVVKNFWNNFDFKQKNALNQVALNDAFSVYSASMPYAEQPVVLKSVDDLIKKIGKNPTMLFQFTKAAEENLYGPRANFWIDEVFLKFLDAVEKNKKIPAARKARYADMRKRMLSSVKGQPLAELKFTGRDGKETVFTPTAKYNLIEFGDPDCDDCRRSRILLEVDLEFNKLLENGKASMTFIVNSEDEDGQLMDQASRYPEKWTVGIAPDVADSFDIRETPSFFIVDGDGVLLAKNISLVNALKMIGEGSTKK